MSKPNAPLSTIAALIIVTAGGASFAAYCGLMFRVFRYFAGME